MKYTRVVKKRGTFKYLFNNGKLKRGKYISMYYIKNNKNINDFGICVSKKNGNSVSRNKLKRWVREIYKENESKIKKGFTIIFSIRSFITFKDINFYVIKEDIEKILEEENFYE